MRAAAGLPREPLLRAAFLFLLAVLFLLPLAIVPWAFDSFVSSKESLLAMAVPVLLALAVGAAAFGAPLRVSTTPVNGFVLLLLLWMALSTIWSRSPVMSLEETARMAVLVGFFIVFQSIVGGRRGRLLMVVYTLALSSLVAVLWTLAQDFRAAFAPGTIGVRQTLGDWRDALSAVALGNTSHLADFIVLGFFLWVGIFLLARGRILKGLSTVALWLHAAALIVCWSVHSNLSLIVAFVLFCFLLRDYMGVAGLRRLRGRLLLLAGGWVFLVAFYVVDHPLNPHGSAVWAPRAEIAYRQAGVPIPEGGFSGGIFSQAFASPRWIAGLDTRLAIWGTSLEIVRHNAWLGTGAGTLTWVFPATRSPLVESNPRLAPYASVWTNASHNELLQFWAELGILGAALLVILVTVAMKNAWDRLEAGTSLGNAVILSAATAMLAAQCVQAQMNFPLQLPVSSLLFLLLLAVPPMLPRRGDEEPELMVPVERAFGAVHLGVVMKNMAYPTEVSLAIRESRGASLSVAAIAGIAALALAISPLQRLRADMAFRGAYEAKRRAEAGMAGWQPVIAECRAALAIWPRHGDALSTMQDALLRVGEFDEVIDMTPRVLQKLNATEVYLRRAEALSARGRAEEATGDWDEVFTRRPDFGQWHPGPYHAFLQRMQSANP